VGEKFHWNAGDCRGVSEGGSEEVETVGIVELAQDIQARVPEVFRHELSESPMSEIAPVEERGKVALQPLLLFSHREDHVGLDRKVIDQLAPQAVDERSDQACVHFETTMKEDSLFGEDSDGLRCHGAAVASQFQFVEDDGREIPAIDIEISLDCA